MRFTRPSRYLCAVLASAILITNTTYGAGPSWPQKAVMICGMAIGAFGIGPVEHRVRAQEPAPIVDPAAAAAAPKLDPFKDAGKMLRRADVDAETKKVLDVLEDKLAEDAKRVGPPAAVHPLDNLSWEVVKEPTKNVEAFVLLSTTLLVAAAGWYFVRRRTRAGYEAVWQHRAKLEKEHREKLEPLIEKLREADRVLLKALYGKRDAESREVFEEALKKLPPEVRARLQEEQRKLVEQLAAERPEGELAPADPEPLSIEEAFTQYLADWNNFATAAREVEAARQRAGGVGLVEMIATEVNKRTGLLASQVEKPVEDLTELPAPTETADEVLTKAQQFVAAATARDVTFAQARGVMRRIDDFAQRADRQLFHRRTGAALRIWDIVGAWGLALPLATTARAATFLLNCVTFGRFLKGYPGAAYVKNGVELALDEARIEKQRRPDADFKELFAQSLAKRIEAIEKNYLTQTATGDTLVATMKEDRDKLVAEIAALVAPLNRTGVVPPAEIEAFHKRVGEMVDAYAKKRLGQVGTPAQRAFYGTGRWIYGFGGRRAMWVDRNILDPLLTKWKYVRGPTALMLSVLVIMVAAKIADGQPARLQAETNRVKTQIELALRNRVEKERGYLPSVANRTAWRYEDAWNQQSDRELGGRKAPVGPAPIPEVENPAAQQIQGLLKLAVDDAVAASKTEAGKDRDFEDLLLEAFVRRASALDPALVANASPEADPVVEKARAEKRDALATELAGIMKRLLPASAKELPAVGDPARAAEVKKAQDETKAQMEAFEKEMKRAVDAYIAKRKAEANGGITPGGVATSPVRAMGNTVLDGKFTTLALTCFLVGTLGVGFYWLRTSHVKYQRARAIRALLEAKAGDTLMGPASRETVAEALAEHNKRFDTLTAAENVLVEAYQRMNLEQRQQVQATLDGIDPVVAARFRLREGDALPAPTPDVLVLDLDASAPPAATPLPEGALTFREAWEGYRTAYMQYRVKAEEIRKVVRESWGTELPALAEAKELPSDEALLDATEAHIQALFTNQVLPPFVDVIRFERQLADYEAAQFAAAGFPAPAVASGRRLPRRALAWVYRQGQAFGSRVLAISLATLFVLTTTQLAQDWRAGDRDWRVIRILEAVLGDQKSATTPLIELESRSLLSIFELAVRENADLAPLRGGVFLSADATQRTVTQANMQTLAWKTFVELAQEDTKNQRPFGGNFEKELWVRFVPKALALDPAFGKMSPEAQTRAKEDLVFRLERHFRHTPQRGAFIPPAPRVDPKAPVVPGAVVPGADPNADLFGPPPKPAPLPKKD